MKSLTLVRHAQADTVRTQVADRERPLSNQGKKDIARMATHMGSANVRPSLILSSSAVRTWETARLVAAELGYPIEFLQREASLYLADTFQLLDIITAQDDGFNHLMIIGHNPGLSDLAKLLVPGVIDGLPTSGWVTIQLDTKTWGLANCCASKVMAFDYPAQVSENS